MDKFSLTSMLSSTANYRPLGFDRRSPPSSLGLDRGVPAFNLERSGMAPPRPSSMLSDGGSATSLESSPRFPLTFTLLVIILAFIRDGGSSSPENRMATLEEEKHEESFDEVWILFHFDKTIKMLSSIPIFRAWATFWRTVLVATSATTASRTRQTL